MLNIYKDLVENFLAIPTITGEKTEKERFAGAIKTFTVETLMRDGKALQSATSHYIGQNFSKPFNIKFQNREGKEEFAYQTSWGISTRLIGAIIMAHGDNRGLKLPPKVAPIQVVVVPIAMHKEGVIENAKILYKKLNKVFRTTLDDRDNYSPGYKFNDWEMRGVPIRIELGPRDIENNKCIIVRRDNSEKIECSLENIEETVSNLLQEIQINMYNLVKENVDKRTNIATNLEELEAKINNNQGYIKAMWCGDKECEEKIKNKTAVKSRCIPFEEEKISNTCVCCGKKAKHMLYWGRQY